MITVDTLVESFVNENFIKTHFSGIDHDKLNEIKIQIKNKIKTQYEKDKVLKEIDSLIDNSDRVFSYSSSRKERLVAMGGAVLTAGINGLIYILVRLSNKNDRNLFKNELIKLRSEVQAIKVKD
jgi:ABC-type Fe2+-enterobactin transport system substrate-binding protein